jgi:hypothetical protein
MSQALFSSLEFYAMRKTPEAQPQKRLCDRFLLLPLLALALLFSGCDILKSLGLIPDDSGNEEPAPYVYVGKGKPVEGAAGMSSIKAKFGVTLPGTDGVDAAFKELSAFIKLGGLETDLEKDLNERVIKLGNWIDLEGGLAVAAYGEGGNLGGFDHDAEAATALLSTQNGASGTLCRLIVVGINSFQSSSVEGGSPPQHVVFQFQNMPVGRRMNSTFTNTGGYRDSEMRQYLTDVGGVTGSGNFLAGLKKAGVPDGVLWAPGRMVSDKQNGPVLIKDKLWLPTEWELFGVNNNSIPAHEKAANQARLEYYVDSTKRRKYNSAGSVYEWWNGSACAATQSFCNLSNSTGTNTLDSSIALGCVPAFCVW